MDRTSRAHLALFVVNTIYGANYVVAKGLMPQVIGPSGFILLRALGACALFWVLRVFRPERIMLQDIPRMVLCAVFGVALNQLMFFNGLMRTSPLHASILMVATPILVLVLSGLLIGERITRSKLVGVVLGAVGAIVLITSRSQGAASGSSMWGDLFILVNAAAYGIYLVLVKPLMSRYSAVTVVAWTFLFGLLAVLPFGWSELAAVDRAALTASQLWAMAFVVVMVTFVAYLLNTWCLRIVNPSVVGSYVYLQPVLAVVFTILSAQWGARLGLTPISAPALGWPMAFATCAIFFGVHLVGRSDKRSR